MIKYKCLFCNKNYSNKINEELKKKIQEITPKQELQRLPIALTEVKAGNTSQKLLNEVRQNIYSLYREEYITKKYVKT